MLKLKIILSTCFLLLFTGALTAQDSLDISLLEAGAKAGTYDNDAAYPAGSALLTKGNLKLIKTNNSVGGADPTKVSTSSSASSFMYQGPMTLDVSSASSPCKKLKLLNSVCTVTVDNSNTFVIGQVTMPYKINDTVTVEWQDPYYVYTGQFNTITMTNGFNGMSLIRAELYDCGPTEVCKTDFGFVKNGQEVTFTNKSDLNAFTADSFQWNFGDGSTSTQNDPSHTFDIGTFEVCLTISNSSCLVPSNLKACQTIKISDCHSGHKTITPNDDGNMDFIRIAAGSKIYDRNGILVATIQSDVDWKGTGSNNNELPTGFYTVICGSGGTYNITVVR